MKKNLYVISGVTGMTGSELARQAVARGETVLGFDNFFASSIDAVCDILDNANFVFCEYDIANAEDMRRIAGHIRRHKKLYQRIIYINCAAVVHTEYFYRIHDTFETNVTAMNLFLEQAIECGAEQFINCSTSEIYSMHSFNGDDGVAETDYALLATAEHSQRTSYAAGKLITEFFTKDAVMNGRIRGCSIRFANVYSKNERFSKHIIPHIIKSLYSTGEVELLENSRINRRTFLHNYDSCAAVLALSDTESALDGGIYNVATDEEVSIIDLVYIIAEKLNIKNPRITFNGFRSADPQRRLLNTEKIRRTTNWSPAVSLSDGLDMCIAHIQQSAASSKERR
ncbi:MAG: NAD(P)-dependent oxidoreductase [Spirochaetaceae bacterium]|jgi:dTDP-glucose 4,6-dehydratase|nr:NAD(P)-dependent oxidoreductase [Spirochaetaceae bacterium]